MIIRRDRPPVVRAGFTLIELMMVIVVIGILAAVAIPAIMGGMKRANDAKQATEISQLGLALEAFKNQFGCYPPSRIRLREGSRYRTGGATPDPFDVMSVEWLRKVFGSNIQIAVTTSNSEVQIQSGDPELWHIWCQDSPNEIEANRILKNNYTPQTYELEGDECLVFFLGGVATILNPSTGAIGRASGDPSIVLNGFSKDPRYPGTVPDSTQPSTLARHTIFFPFAANRLYLRSQTTGTAWPRTVSAVSPKLQSDWVYEFGATSTPNYLEDNSANLCLPSYRPITGRADGPSIAYFSSYNGRGYRPDDFNYPDEDVSPGFQILWPVTTFSPNNPMSEGPNPYTTTQENLLTTSVPNSIKAFLPDSYQIIVAGADGKFGVGGVLGPRRDVSGTGAGTYNSAMPQKDANYDNFSNVAGSGQKIGDFHESLLSK